KSLSLAGSADRRGMDRLFSDTRRLTNLPGACASGSGSTRNENRYRAAGLHALSAAARAAARISAFNGNDSRFRGKYGAARPRATGKLKLLTGERSGSRRLSRPGLSFFCDRLSREVSYAGQSIARPAD